MDLFCMGILIINILNVCWFVLTRPIRKAGQLPAFCGWRLSLEFPGREMDVGERA